MHEDPILRSAVYVEAFGPVDLSDDTEEGVGFGSGAQVPVSLEALHVCGK